MKKSRKHLLFIVLLIVVVIAICYLYLYSSITINFKDVHDFEYGEKINAKDFVIDSNAEEIIYPEIDTSVVGEQKLNFKLKYHLINKTISYNIVIKDTKAPIIEIENDEVTIRKGENYDPRDNVVKVYDVIDGEIDYDIESNYDPNIEGEYEIKILVKDKNANESCKTFKIIVEEYHMEVIDGVTYINDILIVNKEFSLPEDYGGVDPVASEALDNLRNDAANAGYPLAIISGYRDYNYQVRVYNNWVRSEGQALADTFSARPGHSEHQTGLTWDIGLLEDDFGDTAAGKWLNDNCAKYGFIIRYPKGKEDITGYKYEPWHVRYVGVENATKIMEQGICLEEYLGLSK